MSDFLIRYMLMNYMLVIGAICITLFGLVNINKWSFFSSAVTYAMVLIALGTFLLARTKVRQFIPALILTISYGLMCIIHIWDGTASGRNIMFIFMYPLGSIMLLGLAWGLTASVILFAVVSAQMFIPGLSKFIYHPDVSIGMAVGYFEVLSMMIVIEIARNSKDRLIEKQNKRLQELREEAETANRAKSEFLATMSHEIRTPLNAVIGLSEIELQGSLPPSSRDNITQIHRSGTTLLGIIGDILDISKIEAGNFELVPAEYDTAALISDTVNLNMVRLSSKPIDFVLEINEGFPAKLIGDELRVKQVLNNLLSNAIKYTDKGTITLSTAWYAAGGQGKAPYQATVSQETKLRFAVTDTGIGIHPEDMGKLFKNYSQLNAKSNRKIEGTGLGLAITKKLVEMMGGNIAVESESGRGSVFTVELIQGLSGTQTIGEDTARELREFIYKSARGEEIDRSWLPNSNVLVVDDITTNLLVVRGLLEPYGLRVDTAASGREAVEMVKAEKYDIVLMDHMMPEMDGVEALGALRKIEAYANTPVIALTANALRGMREFYLEQGFQDYLSKPIDPQELDEVLKRWVRTGNREQGTGKKEQSTISNVNIAVELESQRLDMLKHYRVAFENIREEDYQSKFDAEYFARFTSLVESFGEFLSPPNLDPQPPFLALYSLIMEAGRRGDGLTLREKLPAFCEALRSMAEIRSRQEEERGAGIGDLREILPKLKTALLAGETEPVEVIIREMGAEKLPSAGRELYIKLYELLLTGETEKALEVIGE